MAEAGRAPELPEGRSTISSRGTGSPIVDQFSLVQGGLIYRFQVAIRMAMPDRSGVLKRAYLISLFIWFPLLVFSFLQGRALDSQIQISFLRDFSVSIRLLIGLPLLVIAEALIDPRLNHAVKHFVESGLVSAELVTTFENVILQINRLRDSVLPGLLILAAAFIPSIWSREPGFIRHGMSTWHTIASPSGEKLSLAGWWFDFISLPLYRVMLFRWIWMIILWAIFLRRTTKIDLRCVATHPDGCGGLGFLVDGQLFFGLIGFASSAVIAGSFGNAIAYQGATVFSLKFLMITWCVLAVVVLAAPLLVVTPKLLKVKRKGIFAYGTLGTQYAREFDAKWVHGLSLHREEMLGTSDIQSLADLRNSFSVVEEMKVVLINKRTLMGLAVPTILPMIPLIMIATPADEVIRAVLKLLL
jgi:hypothetical protein